MQDTMDRKEVEEVLRKALLQLNVKEITFDLVAHFYKAFVPFLIDIITFGINKALQTPKTKNQINQGINVKIKAEDKKKNIFFIASAIKEFDLVVNDGVLTITITVYDAWIEHYQLKDYTEFIENAFNMLNKVEGAYLISMNYYNIALYIDPFSQSTYITLSDMPRTLTDYKEKFELFLQEINKVKKIIDKYPVKFNTYRFMFSDFTYFGYGKLKLYRELTLQNEYAKINFAFYFTGNKETLSYFALSQFLENKLPRQCKVILHRFLLETENISIKFEISDFFSSNTAIKMFLPLLNRFRKELFYLFHNLLSYLDANTISLFVQITKNKKFDYFAYILPYSSQERLRELKNEISFKFRNMLLLLTFLFVFSNLKKNC